MQHHPRAMWLFFRGFHNISMHLTHGKILPDKDDSHLRPIRLLTVDAELEEIESIERVFNIANISHCKTPAFDEQYASGWFW